MVRNVVIAILILFSAANGATIRVPQDQATIQAGINAAVDGDTVLVGPGVYEQSFNFLGKSVVVKGELGAENTILTSSAPVSSLIILHGGEDTLATLEGFSMSNVIGVGSNTGLISIVNSSCRIRNCIFSNNNVWSPEAASPVIHHIQGGFLILEGNRFLSNRGYGGPCYMAAAQGRIENNIFVDNVAEFQGGAINVAGIYGRSQCLIRGNLFVRNISRHIAGASASGGAVFLSENDNSIVENNTFVGNRDFAGDGGAIGIWYYCYGIQVKRNIFIANQGYAIANQHESTVALDCNDAFLNLPSDYLGSLSPGSGSFSSDPLFCDTSTMDFSVDWSSPCSGANNSCGTLIGAYGVGCGVPDPRKEVPTEYATIQSAIDAAADGDTVFVHAGQYSGTGNRDINPLGKSIFIISASGAGSTLIDCGGTIAEPHRGFRIGSSEDTTTIIRGFTIRNGIGLIDTSDPLYSYGGAILCLGSSPLIESCVFDSNSAGVGGALAIKDGGEPIVRECTFKKCSAVWGAAVNVLYADAQFDRLNIVENTASAGGVIDMNDSSPMFKDCFVLRNLSGEKAPIVVFNNSTPLFERCTITRNSGFRSSAFYFESSGPQTTTLVNCLIAFNSPQPSFTRIGDQVAQISCTDIFGNSGGDWVTFISSQLGQNGNISANPLFCDTASGDYRIRNSSPCAPANNSCGVLIGAYGIGCENIAPVISSNDSLTQITRTRLAYRPTASDEDGPAMNYLYANLPYWLAQVGDSVVGTPGLDDVDTSFLAIVSDGFLADSLIVPVHLIATPLAGAITVDGQFPALHVIISAPKFAFDYLDPTSLYPQTAFEIAVGTDNDWQYSEMWNPAPFASSDTFVVYNGAPLIDGQSYWLRLRVSNSLGWSNWEELMFRMNSVPGVPQLRLPVDAAIVNSEHPTLVVRNPVDAENDSLYFTFELSSDNFVNSIVPFTVKASADSLTSFWVNFPLNEDLRFWWRVKSSDYYEESVYSEVRSFWVNAFNSSPGAFNLLSPPNLPGNPLHESRPQFVWKTSREIDPGDSVNYTLYLSLDSLFGFVNQVSGLDDTSWTPASPLLRAQRYWWKVRALDMATGTRWSDEVFSFKIMQLGDADGNGIVTISDAVFLINYIFAGGPAPNPLEGGDADCNGLVSISDVVYLINYIFAGGTAPCEG